MNKMKTTICSNQCIGIRAFIRCSDQIEAALDIRSCAVSYSLGSFGATVCSGLMVQPCQVKCSQPCQAKSSVRGWREVNQRRHTDRLFFFLLFFFFFVFPFFFWIIRLVYNYPFFIFFFSFFRRISTSNSN